MGLVLTDLPSGTGWEFGGFAYGLEPLTLPHPGTADLPSEDDPAAEFGETCRLIRQIGALGVGTDDVEPCPRGDELYWFRWIIGHQVSFIVWRLMAQAMDDAAAGRLALPVALRRLCHYVRGYSVMLLYSGSCSRDTYHDVIRPSMRLRHPSFSGSWAADYAPVRDLLRVKRLPFARTAKAADLGDLLAAIRVHQLVHDGVAAKLVPNGKSLLQQSGVRRQDTRLLNLIYDNYFLTLRAPVTRNDVIAQLLRRLVAIAQDLAVNDLHSAGGAEADEQVQELHVSEVVASERNITAILAQVADCAGELPEEHAQPLVAGRRFA